MTIYSWSQTAASNSTADATINWQEGQAPSSVNNSARAMMAAVAKWRDDMSGNLVTGGTSTAYTVTSNGSFTSLADGVAIALRMNATNGAAPTLNVDSLGAKAIATVFGTAVGTGKLRSGGVYVFVYDATDDKWIVQGNPNEGFEAGTKMVFRQTAAPAGWTKDTTYTDAALRVTSGTISEQATAGKEFSTLFAARTITQAMLPNVTLSGTTNTTGAHTHTANSNGTETNNRADGGATCADNGTHTTSSNGDHSHTVTVSLGGSGADFPFDVNFVDLIIATRD